MPRLLSVKTSEAMVNTQQKIFTRPKTSVLNLLQQSGVKYTWWYRKILNFLNLRPCPITSAQEPKEAAMATRLIYCHWLLYEIRSC